MTEYIKNVNEFVSNVDTSDKEFPTSVEELSELLEKIENDTFMKFHNKVIFDISGHTLRYTEIAKTYLVEKVQYLLKVAYITHMVVSVIIMCVFLTFIMKQIREQMNVMRVLTNIIFTIPLPVFKSVPKLQNFIETGKII
ncbi:hypothetical protein BCR36DRAFT_62816 [Piromyces finnis]|uniref:Uncharacterized protein n=1 Tax=Piromyces finnis TaxID=1754191 RepID=A0A1Y1V904_9FUNG|nr:hypothetical protein BCR36DRAFT_62816 [Piromyces finnis]|eukprot:ORX50008.1 hypothetical protein BCR36DRAFT_62816 [Piromyces finnis]